MSSTKVQVKNYLGSSFVTQHSVYKISKDGRFEGRPSIEGAELELIGGLEKKFREAAIEYLITSMPELKEKLDLLIKEKGQKIKPGLIVVASLTSEYVEKKQRHGIVTSTVKDVFYVN